MSKQERKQILLQTIRDFREYLNGKYKISK
jgi:hypothetical protein